MFNLETIIREYLPEVIHLSLATSRDNKPWICEVHYSYDDNLNFYFLSLASRRHSEDIALNKHVAGNIIKQHAKGENVRGVYFEGTAERLRDVDESHAAYTTYRDRFGIDSIVLKDAKTEEGHKFYKITVNTFYVFDGIESSPAKKFELKWKSK